MQGHHALAALFQQGLAHHQQGELEEAKVAYERMLALPFFDESTLQTVGHLPVANGQSLLRRPEEDRTVW
jgi:hypothetical protein